MPFKGYICQFAHWNSAMSKLSVQNGSWKSCHIKRDLFSLKRMSFSCLDLNGSYFSSILGSVEEYLGD